MRILVTGASGFVGARLVTNLIEQTSHEVVTARRTAQAPVPNVLADHAIGELGAATDWCRVLSGVDTVIHLAARVHVMNETAPDALALFQKINVEASLSLARQAAGARVRRLVYVSSIKVNGESTQPHLPFRPDDSPAPCDPYGISKAEAESALRQLSQQTGLELVVVRPPLVYGPGVRANFRNMMGWLRRGVPLPLGAIDNRRSLIALDNLCSLLITCAQHPAAPGHTFLASDGEDVSTTQLLRRLGLALGSPARLLPVPPALLRLAFGALGRSNVAHRLLGSLQVDGGAARTVLGWQPPLSLDEGLRLAAQAFAHEGANQ